MKFIKGIFASEPIVAILGLAGTTIGGILWAMLPEEHRPMIFAVLGPLVAAGAAARNTTVSPATHGAGVAVAAKRPIEEIDGDVGHTGVVPMPLEPIIKAVALDVAAKTGGLAGKLAKDTVNKVLGSATGVVGKRLGRLFGK